MIAQAQAEQPHECCGLLAGPSPAVVTHRYPLINDLASAVEYLSDPKSMFDAVRDMRRHGIDVVAVYHSHPTSAPVPSRTDLERNYSPEVVNFIISLKNAVPEVRGWWLTADSYREAEWELGKDASDLPAADAT